MSLFKDAKPEDFKVLGQENNEVETVEVEETATEQSEETTDVVEDATVVEETETVES